MSGALVVNVSNVYNLGAHKIAAQRRDAGLTVEMDERVRPMFVADFDEVWISAVFSWDVPKLIEAAAVALTFNMGRPVAVGGPGTFGLRDMIRERLHLMPQATPDARFEGQAGSYKAVFWSRGCPAYNCALGYPKDGSRPLCIVPEIEGSRFTLYPEALPAPVILDNNLSALPRRHQEHIVERTLAAGFRKVDAQSGFEPHSFRPETAQLWKRLPLVAWRFAYDEVTEGKAVKRTVEILDGAGVKRRNMHIYCIAGNEPIDACEQRVHEIRSWKAVPIVQKRIPLDYIAGPLPTLHDWTPSLLADFKRWGNRCSHSMPWSKYDRKLNHSGVKMRSTA